MKRNPKLHEPDLVVGAIVAVAVAEIVAAETVAAVETGGKTLRHEHLVIN
jgi:hypothetical protein